MCLWLYCWLCLRVCVQFVVYLRARGETCCGRLLLAQREPAGLLLCCVLASVTNSDDWVPPALLWVREKDGQIERSFLCSLILPSVLFFLWYSAVVATTRAANPCKWLCACACLRVWACWPNRQQSWMFMETVQGFRKLDPCCIIHGSSTVTASPSHTHTYAQVHAQDVRFLAYVSSRHFLTCQTDDVKFNVIKRRHSRPKRLQEASDLGRFGLLRVIA